MELIHQYCVAPLQANLCRSLQNQTQVTSGFRFFEFTEIGSKLNDSNPLRLRWRAAQSSASRGLECPAGLLQALGPVGATLSKS